MPKRLAIRLVNFVWYSIALLMVLTAMVVTTGRELLPRINFDNNNIANYLEKQTGANIQTIGLRCQWIKLYPEFSLTQLLVSTPELDIQLDNVRLDIDIVNSLLQRTPVLDKLQLSDAKITYRQPENTTTPTKPSDPEKIWRIVNLLLDNDVHIQNVALEWHKGEKIQPLHLNDFRVEKGFSSKKIFLRMLNQQGEQNLYAVGEIEGNELQSSEGKLYIQAENWLLNDWAPIPAQQLLTLHNGEIWLEWEGMHTLDAIAKLHVYPESAPDSTTALPDSIDTELSVRWKKNDTSIIDIHALSLQQEQKTLPLLSDTRISLNTTHPAQWRAQAPVITLKNFTAVNDYLPDGSLKKLFASLDLQGDLRNVDLQWDNNKPLTERMQLRANADNISSSAWNGVPAFTQVSGYLQSGIGYGFIDLDSRNGFSMFYPTIYHEPMAFQSATGRVQWQWLPEKETVLVGSDYASLSGEAGEARGNFWLHLPINHGAGEMYLAIGLRNSEARYRDTFLPYILPANLLAWLKNSIGDGAIPDAGFIYRGSLSRSDASSSAVQFYANINNADLQFDPAWPRLTQLNARLLVDDDKTTVRANSGLIYNTAIQGAYVEVLQQNPGLSINVNARARGYAEDGVRVLKETPLKTFIGTGIDSWRVPNGLLSAGLQLQIPLAGSTVPAKEDVRISLLDTQIVMDDLRLAFKAINGDINYQTQSGLSAPNINAKLFEKPLQLKIASEKTTKSLTININAKGNADVIDIANWSKLAPLKILSGQMDYNAALKLGPFGATTPTQLGQLQITSDLNNVTAPLPAPFSKQRGEPKPFSLTVVLLPKNQQNYQLEYNKQLSGFVSVRDGNMLGGELALLAGTASMPANSDISQRGSFQIRGTLPTADVQQWLDLLASYKAQETPPTAGTSSLYPTISLTVNNATWKDLSFPQLQLFAGHENNAWNIYFDSGNVRGSAFFYDNNKPTEIALSELKFYRNKNTTSPTVSSIPSNTINFSDVPSMNIRIDHLLVDDMDVGSISTELRSTATDLRFEKLLATGPGYRLRDGSGTTGSILLWRRNSTTGEYSSEFHGLLHMQGAQPALSQLGIDMFILGENIYLFADLTWPGTPQQINVKSMVGNIYTSGKNGKYLQANPNAAMRALGIINVATWARRLRLDFSDLRNDGISFDEYKGKLEFGKGVMKFSEPLEVQSPSSALKLSGKALLDKELLDLHLVATLPVGNNATWIAALAGGLPAAAGVYVVSKVFDKQINSLTSLSYSITGPMNEPNIQFERIAPLSPKKEKAKPPAKPTGATK